MTASASYFAAVSGVSSGSISGRNSYSIRESSSILKADSSKIGLPFGLRLSRVMPIRNLACAIFLLLLLWPSWFAFIRQAVFVSSLFSGFPSRFVERLQHADTLLQCALQQHRVYPDRKQAEAFSPVLAAPIFIRSHAGEDFAVLVCGGDHFFDCGDVFWMVELRRDAEEIGQVEVPEPEHVH